MNPLRQAALIHTQAKVVAGWRSQICQTVVQIKNEGSRYQSAERDGRVAALKPPQRIAADKETCGHVARGDAALAPREREVTPQLAKRTFGGQRHGCDWLRHRFSVCYNSRSVNVSLLCQTLLINHRQGLFIECGHLPRPSFENVRQLIRRLPECVGGDVGILFGNSRRIVADEFPRHGVRHACRFKQGGGRVTQRVKADFVLFARDIAALRSCTRLSLAQVSSYLQGKGKVGVV